MSRESFLREAATFAEGTSCSPEREKMFCVAAGFRVVCDLPQCKEHCRLTTITAQENNDG